MPCPYLVAAAGAVMGGSVRPADTVGGVPTSGDGSCMAVGVATGCGHRRGVPRQTATMGWWGCGFRWGL